MVSANDAADERAEVNRRDALGRIQGDRTTANRRVFLRGTVASVAAAIGFSGAAAALDPTGEVELRQLERQYEPVARETARAHADDLLGLLAEHGYLADGSIEEFDRVHVAAWRVGETATARIDGRLERADGRLSISIEPETGRAYAVDDGGDGWTVLRVDSDGTLDASDVTPQGTICISGVSCAGCEEHEYACADGGCHISPTGVCCTDCQQTCNC